jgi:hypothetical protein
MLGILVKFVNITCHTYMELNGSVLPEDLNGTEFCAGPVSLTSREDIRLRVFENRVLRKIVGG